MFEVTITADVGGTVAKVVAPVGSSVSAFDDVLILESMKMEFPVSAPGKGTIIEILVKEGDVVEEGQAVAVLNSIE